MPEVDRTAMDIKNHRFLWVFAAILLNMFVPLYATASEVIIIANKNVQENSLKAEELRNIFLGDQSVWSNEKRINFVILRKGTVHTSFLESYVQKTPKNFVRYWKRQIMTGKAVIPKLALSEAEVIEYVALTEGAIGYVSEISEDNDIKIIDIIK